MFSADVVPDLFSDLDFPVWTETFDDSLPHVHSIPEQPDNPTPHFGFDPFQPFQELSGIVLDQLDTLFPSCVADTSQHIGNGYAGDPCTSTGQDNALSHGGFSSISTPGADTSSTSQLGAGWSVEPAESETVPARKCTGTSKRTHISGAAKAMLEVAFTEQVYPDNDKVSKFQSDTGLTAKTIKT